MTTSFLQTAGWADFAASVGDVPVWIEWQGDRILALERRLRFFGHCLSISRSRVPVTDELLRTLRNVARSRGCMFVRCEPEITDPSAVRMLEQYGSRVKDFMPSQTIIVDLHSSPEALRAAQHPKMRYNIGLAERKGVVCAPESAAALPDFLRIIGATYDRKGKQVLPTAYYEKLLAIPGAQLWTARFDGRVVVANLCIGSGDTYVYLHGGSDDAYKQLMAPHLLQWEQMRYAKEQGYHWYDLWGIDETRYSGVTRFKRGFGGREVAYIGTWELPIRPVRYALYRWLKRRLRS